MTTLHSSMFYEPLKHLVPFFPSGLLKIHRNENVVNLDGEVSEPVISIKKKTNESGLKEKDKSVETKRRRKG